MFVDAAWVGAKPGDIVSDSSAWFSMPGQVFTFGTNAFATVQSGVNGAGSAGTVDIAAGNYQENVTITQPVSLIGPNANVSGGSATRGAESVIDGGTATAFTVQNALVSFVGLTVMGNGGISANGGVSVQDDIVSTTNLPAVQISGGGATGGFAISSLVVDNNSLICPNGQGANLAVGSSGSLTIQSMDVSNNIAASGSGGFINVTAEGDLTLGTASASLTINGNGPASGASAGAINLTAQGGSLSLAGSSSLSLNNINAGGSAATGGAINLTATGGNVGMGDGSVFNGNTLNSGSGGGITLIGNGSATAGGSINLGSVTVQGNSMNVAGPAINLSASGGITATGNITIGGSGGLMVGGVTIPIGQQNIITGSGSISSGNITLTAGNGSIGLGNFTIDSTSISGPGGNIILMASSGSISTNTFAVTNSSLSGGINVSGTQIQMAQLNLGGNTFGGGVSLSAAGGSGDLTIGGTTPNSNQSVTISNNKTQTVGQDETITVHSDRDLTVNGNSTLTVNKNERITISANRDESVSKDETVTISGNRTETVGKNESITISGGRDVTVGGNTTISTNTNETITIGGGRTTTVGKGETITISGNRTETVGQNQSITIGSGSGDLTLGTVAAGNNSIGGSISLTATGGNVSMGDGSAFIANTIGGTASGDAIDIIASGTVPPTTPPTGGGIILLPGASGLLFQGNSITTSANGINLSADANLSGGPIQFLGNTIGGTAGGDGVSLTVGGAASTPVLFTSNSLSGSGAWKGIYFTAASDTTPTTLYGNTIGGSAGSDGVLVSPIGANTAWSGPITIGGSGSAQGNLITGNFIGVSLDGGTGAGGGFTGPITLVGNTIGGTAGGDALYCRKAGENPGNLISSNLLNGPMDTTSIGIDVDQSAAGSSGFMIQANNINGFGNGVQLVSGTGGAIDVTIGGNSPALGNTIQTLRDAILASGPGTNVVVSNNSDPIYLNYEGIDGEVGSHVESDHNKWIEVSSYQFGVSRGISASTGATVTSSFDSFYMLPGIPSGPLGNGTISAIYVDGGNFSGKNDLIDGGGSSGVVSQAIGLQVGSDENPSESITFVYGELRAAYQGVDNQSQSGAVVDASFNAWGVNQESSITQLIGGNPSLVDYSPWLDSATNTLPPGPGGKVLPGFVGDLSTLDVGSGGAEVQTGGRINEAIGMLPPGGTIQISAGAYTENPIIGQNMTLRSASPNLATAINGVISISGGVALRLQFPSPALLQVAGINSQGTLDLTNSTLLINYGAGLDPIVAIRGELTAGYNGGGWNGTPTSSTGAITSSAAQANPNHNTAIGYADSADGQGVNTTPNTIELTYTLYGDTNLDHIVNSADLQRFLNFFNTPGGWDQGDFNYDGVVNSADQQLILFTFNTSLGNQVAAAVNAGAGATVVTPGGSQTGSGAGKTAVVAAKTLAPEAPHLRPTSVSRRKHR